jgi:hypothetical protein
MQSRTHHIHPCVCVCACRAWTMDLDSPSWRATEFRWIYIQAARARAREKQKAACENWPQLWTLLYITSNSENRPVVVWKVMNRCIRISLCEFYFRSLAHRVDSAAVAYLHIPLPSVVIRRWPIGGIWVLAGRSKVDLLAWGCKETNYKNTGLCMWCKVVLLHNLQFAMPKIALQY